MNAPDKPAPSATPATIDDLLFAALAEHPERIFIRCLGHAGEERVSYRAAIPRLAATVAALHARGIASGDRVVCYLDEPMDALCFMLAAACAGVVFVPLSPTRSIAAVARLVARVAARAVFSTAARVPALEHAGLAALCYRDPNLPGHHAAVIDPSPPPLSSDREAVALLDEARRGHDADHPYVILPTSGTTDEPKLVVRSHRSFSAIAPHMRLGAVRTPAFIERVLMAAALTHGIGHANLAYGLSMAAEFALPRSIEGQTRLAEVRALDPTYVYANPRVVNTLLSQYRQTGDKTGDQAGDHPLFGPSLRILRMSGAPSTPELRQVLQQQGIDFGETYGLSEAGAVASTAAGDTGMRVHSDVQMRIDEDNQILVRTSRGMSGYYDDDVSVHASGDASTPQRWTDDGFYRTGDLGEIRADGVLRLWARERDRFNLPDGSNLDPVPIESMLEFVPWVHQVVLVGDARPFIIVLLMLREPDIRANEDGYLAPARATGDLYARARTDLAAVNARLEPPHRIRRFCLFTQPMPPTLYAEVQGGKTRRERALIAEHFAARIEAVYAGAAGAETESHGG